MIRVGLFGYGAVGKTTFLNRLRTADYSPRYTPTVGVSEVSVEYGGKEFRFYDFAGQEKFQGDLSQYDGKMDYVLLFCSFESKASLINTRKVLFAWVLEHQPSAQIILVCNKCDVKATSVKQKDLDETVQVMKLKQEDVVCFSISCKKNTNLYAPLDYIVQQ